VDARIEFLVEDVPEDSPYEGQHVVPVINGARFGIVVGPLFKEEIQPDGWMESNNGLDPVDVFLPSRRFLTPSSEAPASWTQDGATMLMTCTCGTWGCSYIAANIEVDDDWIHWREVRRWRNPLLKPCPDFRFSRTQYEEALSH
jgi:hypothetical protein